MKIPFMLGLVLVLVLACAGAACADGWSIGVDLTDVDFDPEAEYLELAPPDVTATIATIDAELAMGSFIAGGLFSTAVSWDESYAEEWDHTLYGVYAGYTFVNNDNLTLAALGGYFVYNLSWEYTPADYHDFEFTSFAVGFKGAAAFGSFRASLLYLYGLSTDYLDDYTDLAIYEEGEGGFSLLQFKGVYQFSETVGAFLVYRTVDSVLEPDTVDLNCGTSGFGLGVEISF